MVLFLKDFLLNVLIISIPFALYPYIHRLKRKPARYKALLFALCATAIFSTMFFPVKLNGLSYDFRSVPLTFGSLYGGWIIALLLYGTVIFGRYLIGSPDMLLYALSFLPSYFVVLLAIKRFRSASLAQRILIAVSVCTLIKIILFALFLFFTDRLHLLWDHPYHMLRTYLLQAMIIGFCVYIIEFLERYYHMQEEAMKSEKMRMVSDMAASVAHEIRNPLTSVRGFIHLLAADGTSQEKKEFYKGICFSELDRAEHIISDYLALVKVEPESREPIDINAEMQYLSNILLTYANFNNVQLNVQLDKNLPMHIMGDRYKFRQALINIGKNAIEAMPNGGTLELIAEQRNNKAAVGIHDTGSGMTTEQLKRLGTPYYSTKEKGTGLGTMISFEIIKGMDGKIDVQSELGKGTAFTFNFPLYKI